MINSIKTGMKSIAVLLLLLFAKCLSAQTAPNNSKYHTCSFNFQIIQTCSTSAGVYNSEGLLIRTLWSGIKYVPGTYQGNWDGVDDEKKLAREGAYQIRVLTNQVKYEWEGVIGNTSAKFTGATLHRAHGFVRGLTSSHNVLYYTTGYNETGNSTFKFSAKTPQQRSSILSKGFVADNVATDDQIAYWSGKDSNSDQCFIYATCLNNDSTYKFSNSTSVKTKYGIVFKSVIDFSNRKNGQATGLAVQKNGAYLFASHKEDNKIAIYEKTTGKLRVYFALNAPSALAVDQRNHLWIVSVEQASGKERALQYEVTNGGTLKATGLSLAGLVQPLALTISPDDRTVVVADAGTSQQIKIYSAVSGKLEKVYGQQGGYYNSPDVTNDKFYFSDVRGVTGAAVTFQADGSLWVDDAGNCRLLHFSADMNYLGKVMYLPTSYCVNADLNNVERVMADYLEFKVDYSKPLQPYNDSWRLIRNWGATITADLDNKYLRFRGLTTLKNQHTYAMLYSKLKRNWVVAELMKNGPLRVTSSQMPDDGYRMYPDGSIYKVSKYKLNQPTSWLKRSLTGFNQNNDPIWGNEETIATLPVVSKVDPLCRGTTVTARPGEVTSSNVIVSFDNQKNTLGSTAFHLGGIKPGTNKWLWRTAIGTPSAYRGIFPPDGAFDNGNSVKYAGSVAMAVDRHILWGYYGEFWKASETNKWNHVYDDGLFIGQMGVTVPELGDVNNAPAMIAGNPLSPALVKGPDGCLYLYHNDESGHSGIHRWKISNLESVKEQNSTVNLSYKNHGLLLSIFSSDDLNNLNTSYTGIASPEGVKISQAGQVDQPFSARYEGFITPVKTGYYGFVSAGRVPVRLWINNHIVVDNFNSVQDSACKDTIYLKAGEGYAVKAEYLHLKSNDKPALYWFGKEQRKQFIPQGQLVPKENDYKNNEFDLLANLPYNAILQDRMYGWERSVATEDYSNRYSNYWTVRTNVKKYDSFQSPDLFINFRQPASTYTVSRNLGVTPSSVIQWKLKAKVNFENNEPNIDPDLGPAGASGSFLEVLDDKGKVLIRMFFHIDRATNDGYLYFNNKIILKTDRKALKALMSQTQALLIDVTKGQVMVKYGDFPPVNTLPFDGTAHWNAPKSVRLYFWSKAAGSNRVIDLEELKYIYKTSR